MSDLISRQAAIDALEKDKASLDNIIKGMSAIDVRLDHYVAQHNQVDYDIDAIKNLPSAKPQERKTGRWVYGEDDSGQDGWTCSECGFFIPWYYDYYGLNNIDFIRDFHTCPHCDAKMLTYTGKEDGGGA